MQNRLYDGVWWYLIFVGSTTCHEAAHAWAALRLGDDTAFRGGQVSLNPWNHIKRSPLGMVVVPILSWLVGGWIMGWASAPYNRDWARQFPRRAGLMALAGPAANFGLAVAAAWLIRIGLEWHYFEAPFAITGSQIAVATSDGPVENVARLLSIGFSLNLFLSIFNLLPIPPLDGSCLPLLVLPRDLALKCFDALRLPIVQGLGFVIIYRMSGAWFGQFLQDAAALLYKGLTTF